MATPDKCPLYGKGDCCLEWHQTKVQTAKNRTLILKYDNDIKPQRTIHVWDVTETIKHGNQWICYRRESAELIDASMDYSYLTSETMKQIRKIHYGPINTTISRRCDFKNS